MPASFNYYDILGLPQGAGAAEIKSAYRKLAMEYHPDKNSSPDAHKQFVAINAAYSVLSDPFKRKVYDLSRQAGRVIHAKPKNTHSPQSETIDPEEMRRRYWSSPAGQRRSQELKRELNIQIKVNSILKMVSIPIILFLLLFLVEKYFPTYVGAQEVSLVEYTPKGGIYKLGTHSVRVKTDYGAYMRACDSVEVYVGRVFKLVTAINITDRCDMSKLWGEYDYRDVPISGSLFAGPGFLIYLVLFFFCLMWWAEDPMHGIAFFIFAFVFNIFIFVFFWMLFP